jgi:hypothetical protein
MKAERKNLKDRSGANSVYSTNWKDLSEAKSVYSTNSKDRSGETLFIPQIGKIKVKRLHKFERSKQSELVLFQK